jgi:hypothetical protein
MQFDGWNLGSYTFSCRNISQKWSSSWQNFYHSWTRRCQFLWSCTSFSIGTLEFCDKRKEKHFSQHFQISFNFQSMSLAFFFLSKNFILWLFWEIQWEKRKAWDILLKAYFTEFTANDSVALYILTSLYHSDSQHTPHTEIKNFLIQFLNQTQYIEVKIALMHFIF